MSYEKKIEDVITLLKEGNDRFRNYSKETIKNNSKKYLDEIKNAQHPIATVVCCVDSRVAPEVVFDLELGKLFVFRIPGSVITPEVMETVEFGAEILKIPLTVIMAHQNCATIVNKVENKWPGKLSSISSKLHYNESMGTDLDIVTKINATESVERLIGESEILKGLIEKNEHRIVPAFYNMDFNKVDFF